MMLLIPVEGRDAEAWLNFKLRDVDLLMRFEAERYPRRELCLFVASLSCPRDVKTMFCRIGEAAKLENSHGIIFRTTNPTVMKWGKRWGAIRGEIPGHRPRFLIRNPVFEQFCVELWEHCLWVALSRTEGMRVARARKSG